MLTRKSCSWLAEQPLLHQGLQTLQHLRLLELLESQPGLIAHPQLEIVEHGVQQRLNHQLLPGLHQLAVEAT